MTVFKPGDRVHLKGHALVSSATGLVVNAERFAGGHVSVQWDDNQAITSHLPHVLEPLGEPMTTYFESQNSSSRVTVDRDSSGVLVGILRDGKTKHAFTVTPGTAPSFVLAILEAAHGNIEPMAPEIARAMEALADHARRIQIETKETAEQEALEGEALHLCRIMWDNPDQAWTPMSPEAKEKWLKMARTARTLHGVTK